MSEELEVDAAELRRRFAENLRAARTRLNMSQTQLSEESGVTQTYISAIENSQANLTLETMSALAKAVGVGVARLLRPV